MSRDALFLSHSKYDEEQLHFIHAVASRAGLRTITMEFEDLDNKYPAMEIRDLIRNGSKAVIVLLGKSLANPPSPEFTHNWVTFEVGVAAGTPIPVWVLEPSDQTIHFPVPYVTDYIEYDIKSPKHIRQIGEILRRSLIDRNPPLHPPAINRCINARCRAVYNCWSKPRSMILYCPVCKQRNDMIEYDSESQNRQDDRFPANAV